MHPMWANREPLITQLQQGLAKLEEALNGLADADLQRPSSNPGWTARDTLVHLVASEATMLEVAENIAAGTSSADPAKHDQAAVNQAAMDQRSGLTLAELIAELKANRQRAIGFAQDTPEDAFTRTGVTPAGRQRTAAEMLERVVAHQEGHLAEVLGARA